MRAFPLGLGLGAAIVALDQLSKWWILDAFDLPLKGMVEVLPFFNLAMVWNRGISFGLMAADGDLGRWLLSGLAIVIILALILWLRQVGTRLLAVAVGLVIGGAVGNLVDRMRFGAVVDFIQLHAAGYSFYVFNVADAAISIGVALLLWDAIFAPQDKPSVSSDKFERNDK